MNLPSRRDIVVFCALLGAFLVGCATTSTKLADTHHSAGNWKAAYDEYEKALPKASQAKKKLIDERLVEIRDRITSASVATADRLATSGAIPALNAAVDSLKNEIRYDNTAKHAQKKLDDLSGRLRAATARHQSALGAAASAETAGNWTVAYTNLNLAVQLSPSDELTSRIRDLINRRDAKAPLDIQQMVSRENLEAAEQALATYLAEQPRPATSLTEPLETAVGGLRKKILEAQLQDLLTAKKYYTAYHLILASKRDYLVKRLSQVRKDGAEYYLEKARQEFAKPLRIGYAYFAAEKAWELLASDENDKSELNNAIFVIRREISDTIDALIKHEIAVITFSSPTVEAQGGVALANALVQNLTESVPYGIEILERQKIENIKAETGTNGVSRVRMFIVGDLTTMNVERKHSEREGTVSAVKGKRSVPNPQYAEYLRQFGNNRAKWPVALRDTPTSVMEDENELVKYKLGQETLNGVMVASVRAFESALGTVKWAKDFKAEQNKIDTFSDPVAIAVPPIALDPLELPTDNEVKEFLRKNLAQQIGAEVLKSFEHREQRYLESAKASLLRREMPEAVADLAGGHFYAHKDLRAIPNASKNAAVSELRQLGFFDCTENP